MAHRGETTMKKSLLYAVTIIWLVAARAAIAQPSNPSFETGDFTSWLVAGTTAASVVGSIGSGPTDGNFQALLPNQFGSVDSSTLMAFFALPAGALNGLGNGFATEGSAIRQTFRAPPGGIFAFVWNSL